MTPPTEPRIAQQWTSRFISVSRHQEPVRTSQPWFGWCVTWPDIPTAGLACCVPACFDICYQIYFWTRGCCCVACGVSVILDNSGKRRPKLGADKPMAQQRDYVSLMMIPRRCALRTSSPGRHANGSGWSPAGGGRSRLEVLEEEARWVSPR